MNNNYCKKTLSGKHIFEEYFHGIDEDKTKIKRQELEKEGYKDSLMFAYKIMEKCIACGMINDKKEL